MAGRKKRFNTDRMRTYYRSAPISDKLVLCLLGVQSTMQRLYEGKGSKKRVLIILRRRGAITQKDLTEHLGIQPASVSYVLAKMEDEELIVRRSCESDKRTAEIILTKKGAAAADEAVEQRASRHRDMFACLTAGERNELLRLLEKINDDWERRFR